MQQNSNIQAGEQPKAKNTFIYKPQGSKSGIRLDPIVWNIITVLINGILGGIFFSLGAVAYLSIDSKYLGSALFSAGMFFIFFYGFGMYTGKIGYCFTQKKEQNLMLIPLWFGNIIGALLLGGIMRLTRETMVEKLAERADELCGLKLADTSGGMLVLSVLCGIIMFIIADNYKNGKTNVQKYLTVIIGTMIFVLCGFEHFVSNVFYFTVANVWTLKAVWYLIVVSVGNSVGALLIPLIHMGVKYLRGLK